MNRSEMVRTAINEFAQKQNPRALTVITIMPQKLKCFKPSKHFSLNLANLKAETSLLSALSHLY
jgi:hypothetical protein